MSTKKWSAFTEATTISGSDRVVGLQGGDNVKWNPEIIREDNDPVLRLLTSLGSPVKAYTVSPFLCNTAHTLVDTREFLIPITLPRAGNLTFICYIQSVQGNYTADQNNRLALYSVASGVLTLRAATANNGDLWKAATGIVSVNLETAYDAPAGTYYIGWLYNNSAQTTAPTIAMTTALGVGISTLDFANGNKLSSYFASSANIVPTGTLMADAAVGNQFPFFGIG